MFMKPLQLSSRMTCMQLAQGNLIRRFENAMSKDVFEVVDKLPGILKPMITFKAIATYT